MTPAGSGQVRGPAALCHPGALAIEGTAIVIDEIIDLHGIDENYAILRRYAPAFLDVLKLRAAPTAKDVLDLHPEGRSHV